MKKVLILISCFLLSITSNVFWEMLILDWTWATITPTTTANTWTIVESQAVSEVTNNDENNKIIYTYYYWEWCSHCAKIDKYMKWVNWYEKMNIEKKEIYFNEENRAEYLDAWKRLWFSEEDLWVPFLVISDNWEETSLSWDKPIIEYFTQFLWEAPKEFNKWFILLFLWLFILVAPFVLLNRK